MSQWEYERDRKIVESNDKQRAAAEKFVQDCLITMDGSLEAGMARIGTERYKHTINNVLKTLPHPEK